MIDQIAVFPSGPLSTNALVVHCKKTRAAAVIDPSSGSLDAIRSYVRGNQLKVEKVLITHSHWDHIADCRAVCQEFQVPLFVHRDDAGNIEDPGSDGLRSPVNIAGMKPTGFLDEGDVVSIGELKLEVLHTPGHCHGHICFYIAELGVFIAGDLFFKGAMGTLGLPTAEPDRMWESLARVARLPKETVVYPGHGETTTIGNEGWLANAKEYYGG